MFFGGLFMACLLYRNWYYDAFVSGPASPLRSLLMTYRVAACHGIPWLDPADWISRRSVRACSSEEHVEYTFWGCSLHSFVAASL